MWKTRKVADYQGALPFSRDYTIGHLLQHKSEKNDLIGQVQIKFSGNV